MPLNPANPLNVPQASPAEEPLGICNLHGGHALTSRALQPVDQWRESPNLRLDHEAVTFFNKATYNLQYDGMVRDLNGMIGHFCAPISRLNGSLAQRLEPRLGELRFTILIPDGKVGLVIGVNGSQIKNLEGQSRCRIISCCSEETKTSDDKRPVNITGTPLGILQACKIIWKVIDSSWDRPAAMTRTSPNQAQTRQRPHNSSATTPPKDHEHSGPASNALNGLAKTSRDDHKEQHPSSSSSNNSPQTSQQGVIETPVVKTCDDFDNFRDYSIRGYHPGHYVPTNEILKNIVVPGCRIRKAQLQEFVENLEAQSKNKDEIRTFSSKLLRENDPTLWKRKGTQDISNLLTEIKENKDEYYSFDDAVKLLEGIETADLYIPTKVSREMYSRHVALGEITATSSLISDSSILWLPVLVSEVARLTTIGEKLAYKTQTKKEEENKYFVLQERYEKLKKEKVARDYALSELREQHSKFLEQYHDQFLQDHTGLIKEKDMLKEQLREVIGQLKDQKDQSKLTAQVSERLNKLRADYNTLLEAKTCWLPYEDETQQHTISKLKESEKAHEGLRAGYGRLENENLEQSKTIATLQETNDRQQLYINTIKHAAKDHEEQMTAL